MAKRIYAAPKAQQPGVVYLTGVGHGAYTTFTGHYYDPIFQVGNYSAAEAYHQDYFTNNARQPYCMGVVAPKVAKFRKSHFDRLKKRTAAS